MEKVERGRRHQDDVDNPDLLPCEVATVLTARASEGGTATTSSTRLRFTSPTFRPGGIVQRVHQSCRCLPSPNGKPLRAGDVIPGPGLEDQG